MRKVDPRASILTLVVAWLMAALALVPAGHAGEPGFPTRSVRIIVPLAPGGGTDNLTRIMAMFANSSSHEATISWAARRDNSG